MIKAGIIGGGGYTAGELIRLLLAHPKAELTFVVSTSQAGKALSEVHQDLIGQTRLTFSQSPEKEADVLFLCMGHGRSKDFVEQFDKSSKTKIIDLSQDFRYQGKDFVYGLPELHKPAIAKAKYVSNPGCFATAMQLSLLPLASQNLLDTEVHINGITGATGAGQAPSETSHFPWRSNNVSTYKAFEHQHLYEVQKSLGQQNVEINFIPIRGNFSRGIFMTSYLKTDISEANAIELYNSYYQAAPFTTVSTRPIHLKQVVNTNRCLLHLKKHNEKLLITTTIDNLLKGASGQAIQNMNLMFGFEERQGLELKAISF